jgi:hypothetical protein
VGRSRRGRCGGGGVGGGESEGWVRRGRVGRLEARGPSRRGRSRGGGVGGGEPEGAESAGWMRRGPSRRGRCIFQQCRKIQVQTRPKLVDPPNPPHRVE